MPALIRWTGQRAEAAEDPFTAVGDEEPIPRGDVIVSLQRFHNEGQRLLGEGRNVGVRIEAERGVGVGDGAQLRRGRSDVHVAAVAFGRDRSRAGCGGGET